MTDFTVFSTARRPPDYPGLSIDLMPRRQLPPYVPQPGTAEAVDVAIGLGRPLLVTGDPGVGKSSLAFAIAETLGLPRAYRFVTRSTSEARDLFYHYDALGRFRDAQLKDKTTDVGDYITYQALGAAILDGMDAEGRKPFLDRQKTARWTPDPEGKRAVLLIDEIDKASRDFANDVLVEVEEMRFRVPELGLAASRDLDHDRRPIVVVTSNSERALPDAFLRRCAFLHLRFPGKDDLTRVLQSHLSVPNPGPDDATGGPRIGMLVDLAVMLQTLGGLSKRPGISEVIDTARILRAFPGEDDNRVWSRAAGALVKSRQDLRLLAEVLRQRYQIALPLDGRA